MEEEGAHLHIEGGGSPNNLPHISLLPQFKCCGAANYTDWETVPLEPKNRVPDSCCVNVTEGCGVNFKVKDIHTEVGRRLRCDSRAPGKPGKCFKR